MGQPGTYGFGIQQSPLQSNIPFSTMGTFGAGAGMQPLQQALQTLQIVPQQLQQLHYIQQQQLHYVQQLLQIVPAQLQQLQQQIQLLPQQLQYLQQSQQQWQPFGQGISGALGFGGITPQPFGPQTGQVM